MALSNVWYKRLVKFDGKYATLKKKTTLARD
jgi:hypothetical protein